LQFQEYDGFVLIESQSNDPIHVVWQVLPKAAAEIAVNATSLTAGTGVLVNASPGVEGATDIFSLVEVDGNDYNYVVGDCTSIDLPPGCNQSPVDIHEVGVRAYTDTVPYDLLEFAVTIWDEPYRAGQYPPEIDIYIDSDADGTDDYVIFNGDLARDGSDGRTIVFLADLATNAVAPWYFIDATFNSQNFILPMDAAAIGVTPGQPFRFSVFTFDAYFTGDLWDCAPKVDEVAPAPGNTHPASHVTMCRRRNSSRPCRPAAVRPSPGRPRPQQRWPRPTRSACSSCTATRTSGASPIISYSRTPICRSSRSRRAPAPFVKGVFKIDNPEVRLL
jgi:hypothetical protein